MFSSTRILRRNTEPAIPESVSSSPPTPPCPELSSEHRSRMNSHFNLRLHNHEEYEKSGKQSANYIPPIKSNMSVDHLPEAIPCTPNSAFSATFSMGDVERRNSHLRHSALKIFTRYKKKKSSDLESSVHSSSIFSSMRPRSAARLSLAVNPVDQQRYVSHSISERRTSILHSKREYGPMTATFPIHKSMDFPPMRNSILPRESCQTALSPTPASSMLKKTHVVSSPDLSSIPTPPILLQPPPSRRRESTPGPINLHTATPALPLHYLPISSPKHSNHQTANSTDSFQSGCSSSSSFIGRSSKVTTPSSIDTSEISARSDLDPDNFPPRTSSKPSSESLIDGMDKPHAIESKHFSRIRSPTPPSRNSESTNPPMVFGTGTAKVARSISGSGVERACIVRCSTPNAISVMSPTRLATSACGSRPASSMSMRARTEEIQSIHSDSNDIIREAILMSPVRAERVDTRSTKQKIPIKRRRASVIGPRTNTPPSPNLALIPDMSPRSPLPSNSTTNSQNISLSCVMTVASTTPDHEQCGNKPPIKKNYCYQTTTSTDTEISTIPGLNGSNVLESNYHTERRHGSIRNRERGANSLNCNSHVTWKSPDEKEKENNSPSDQNMESRVRRMEQDNAVLLSTLNTIVKKLEDMRCVGNDVVVDELKGMKSSCRIENNSSWSMQGTVQNSPGRFKESDVIFNTVNY